MYGQMPKEARSGSQVPWSQIRFVGSWELPDGDLNFGSSKKQALLTPEPSLQPQGNPDYLVLFLGF